MTVQKLEKADWSSFFNHLSKTLAGSQAEIDVGSLALGGQVQANLVALFGLVYDPKDDLVEVALEGLDHLIHNQDIRRSAGKIAQLPELAQDEGLWRVNERAFVVRHLLTPGELALFDTNARMIGNGDGLPASLSENVGTQQ